MNIKNLSLAIVVLAALAGLAAFLNRPTPPPETDPRVGASLLATNLANTAQSIRIAQADTEVLLSREERVAAEDLGQYFRIPPDLRDLNYAKFVEEGDRNISEAEDYNSRNTNRLDVDGVEALVAKLTFMQAIARGEHAVPED